MSLPKRETDHDSGWEPEYGTEWLDIYCPECAHTVSFSWDDLEAGTEHKCSKCKYEWEVA